MKNLISRLIWLTTSLGVLVSAQSPQSAVLTVDMENVVQYQENFANQAKNGSSSSMEPTIGVPLPFSPGYFIADITAINGKRCKGTTVARNLWFGLTPNASGSQAIGDVVRNQAMEVALEIQQTDGSAIGAIFLTGLTAGPPPSGAPRAGVTGIFTIIGGTGAFLGARGQAVTVRQAGRFTSTTENPLNRRNFPAGAWRLILQLLPLSTPQIYTDGDNPVVVHSSDSSRVTADKPARAGELLVLRAVGLGPTTPGVDPGDAFPETPAQAVSAPIEVLVNGTAAEVVSASGFPNTTDQYLVSFRVPSDTRPGQASVQLVGAWVAGAAMKIPVQ